LASKNFIFKRLQCKEKTVIFIKDAYLNFTRFWQGKISLESTMQKSNCLIKHQIMYYPCLFSNQARKYGLLHSSFILKLCILKVREEIQR
uniref:Uncharacterized protein n=1 Tax=Crocodylus porosus TaxID=8502 RepID=A0A7M4EE18_CROPO